MPFTHVLHILLLECQILSLKASGDEEPSKGKTIQALYSKQLCELHGIGCGTTSEAAVESSQQISKISEADVERTKAENDHQTQLLEMEISQLEKEIKVLERVLAEQKSLKSKLRRLINSAIRAFHRLPFKTITVVCYTLTVFAVFFLITQLVETYDHYQSDKLLREAVQCDSPEEAIETIMRKRYANYIWNLDRKGEFLRALRLLPIIFFVRTVYFTYIFVTTQWTSISAFSMTLSAITGFKLSSACFSILLVMVYSVKQCFIDFIFWKPLPRISFTLFQKRVFEHFKYNARTMDSISKSVFGERRKHSSRFMSINE